MLGTGKNKVAVKQIFLLGGKKILFVVVLEFLAIFLHNAIGVLFGAEEAIFFIAAVFVLPIYFLIALPYSVVQTATNTEAKKERAGLVGILILTAYGVLVSEFLTSRFIVMLADLISGFSVIGIAVLLLPYFKKVDKNLAYGYIFLKVLEGVLMVAGGVIYLFGPFQYIRGVLYGGVHLWVFILGAFVFYHLLYKSKLVPQFISMWGYAAIFGLFTNTALKLMGVSHPILDTLLLLVITNEVFLAGWLIFKGFSKKN